MRTISETARIAGISVRTLHHYDAIGLLKPAEVTAAGYRLYDDAALERLQRILLFRELQFPLKEIQTILDSPGFDPSEALAQQIRLLELQRQHIDRLITLAREIQEKGEHLMNFDAFDRQDLSQYREEVRKKWAGTPEYQEYAQREACGRIPGAAARQMVDLFAELGALRHLSPADPAVQAKIRALQDLITSSYYTCSRRTLAGLGQMYAGDARFTQNIDRVGGEGTAKFASAAISIYCASAQQD